jgi:hypothetical protein
VHLSSQNVNSRRFKDPQPIWLEVFFVLPEKALDQDKLE